LIRSPDAGNNVRDLRVALAWANVAERKRTENKGR